MATQESNPCENLPRDLITEILLRLPVKSLFKFRCVSKSWLSLISSPEFKTTYLEVSTSRQRLIFGSATALYTCSLFSIFDEHPSVDDAPFDFASDDPRDSIRIVGSCKGLFCLAFLRTGSIILWNPAIRKYRQLPFRLRNNLWVCYGFGYDASSDDYKVVQIDHGSCISSFSIYSSRNNSWKFSADWPHGIIFGRSGVFMNGAIHWMVDHNDNDIGWAVVVQSLAMDQNFSSVALPVHPDECQTSGFLGVLGERLCACFDCGFSIDVWVMEEYGVKESWRKVVCIPLDDYSLGMEPLLVTEKGVVLVKADSKLMPRIQVEYGKIIQLSDDMDAEAATYAESFVNPNFDHVVGRLACN